MTTTTSVPEPTATDTREGRGLALYRERGDQIRHVRGAVWTVPSCTRAGVYLVDLVGGVCTCADMPPAGEVCKHTTAATIARAKSGVCSGCGLRFRRRELVELVEGNHDNLAYFDGDFLCPSCADAAGVEH
jgi:5-methylcytosine-specific restriction endonuclease McrA